MTFELGGGGLIKGGQLCYYFLYQKLTFDKDNFANTFKPVLRGHLWDKEKVAL
jgi:hypothetical protein